MNYLTFFSTWAYKLSFSLLVRLCSQGDHAYWRRWSVWRDYDVSLLSILLLFCFSSEVILFACLFEKLFMFTAKVSKNPNRTWVKKFLTPFRSIYLVSFSKDCPWLTPERVHEYINVFVHLFQKITNMAWHIHCKMYFT